MEGMIGAEVRATNSSTSTSGRPLGYSRSRGKVKVKVKVSCLQRSTRDRTAWRVASIIEHPACILHTRTGPHRICFACMQVRIAWPPIGPFQPAGLSLALTLESSPSLALAVSGPEHVTKRHYSYPHSCPMHASTRAPTHTPTYAPKPPCIYVPASTSTKLSTRYTGRPGSLP